MISTMAHGFSISMRTTASYRETIQHLRAALARHGLEVLFEFPLLREMERRAGLPWAQLGMNWKHYTVLLVWSPSDACPALLSGHDGGLLVPFKICIAEGKDATFILADNPAGVVKVTASLGAQTLARDQTHRIRNVFSELVPQNGVANAV
ncbi:MAG TPA: hypothetical protein VKX41_16950 [Alloacidobacterium sp.]|jgi:uncharacterized protein (DUF302 family)|nr:hypothetical protein [Alloacidobacterium sp.]